MQDLLPIPRECTRETKQVIVPMQILTERNGRVACWMLVIVDIFLGGTAVFFPRLYAQLLHPELTSPPVDFIVRTGILWLVFMVFQLIAANSKDPVRWFFLVGVIRLMEVPADIAYGILAIGSPLMSRLMILGAPVLNSIFGIFLVMLSKRLEGEKGVEEPPHS